MIKQLSIRDLKLKNNLLLAPMSGINTYAFRKICKEHGCGLVSTWFYSANALARKPKLSNLIDVREDERPVSVQLFSGNSENFASAIKAIEEKADVIDINLGCPDSQIRSQGAGAALLARPNKIKEIIEKARKVTEKPLSAKLRLGMSNKKINIEKTAKICEDSGCDFITIHCRTVNQGYSGKAKWHYILNVKNKIKIPVIANGDINNGFSAEQCFLESQADGFMIGREAIKNPYVFEDILYYFKTHKKKELTSSEIKKRKMGLLMDYLKYCDKRNLNDIKCHAIWFTKDVVGSRVVRDQLSRAKSISEIIEIIEKLRT